jgi:uncharacterized secreted protein with C-terminal beta-propeller domain
LKRQLLPVLAGLAVVATGATFAIAALGRDSNVAGGGSAAPGLDGPTASVPGSYEDLYDVVSNVLSTAQYAYREEAATGDAVFDGASGSGEPSSLTNTQVRGIDEADAIKTDGKHIFAAAGFDISVFEVAGAATKPLAKLTVGSSFGDTDQGTSQAFPIQELMLVGDRLVVIQYGTFDPAAAAGKSGHSSSRDDLSVSTGDMVTVAKIYDVSAPANPTFLTKFAQSGTYLSSRLSDGQFYLISNHCLWNAESLDAEEPLTFAPYLVDSGAARPLAREDIRFSPSVADTCYTVITSLDVARSQRIAEQSVLGASGTIYMSQDNLYLASYAYVDQLTDGHTKKLPADVASAAGVDTGYDWPWLQIVRVGLNDGQLVTGESTILPGSLHNQFSLDEYQGHLRVVADVFDWTSGPASGRHTSLYVLTDGLELVGSVPSLIEDETVQSVRFIGDVGYVVTFEVTDPLFAVDLKNPAKPRVMSELELPGFSSYLHPWADGLLLGLGFSGDEFGLTQGAKVSMFDVSDPFAVTEAANLTVPGGLLEAAYSHKAVLVDSPSGLIGFATSQAGGVGPYGQDVVFEVIEYSADGFKIAASLPQELAPLDGRYSGNTFRGYVVDGYLYVCSVTGVNVYSLADNFAQVASV